MVVTPDDYKVVLYRNQPEGWVAEVPSISAATHLCPPKRTPAELEQVFDMIAAEYRAKRLPATGHHRNRI